jgi:hypothetical protein
LLQIIQNLRTTIITDAVLHHRQTAVCPRKRQADAEVVAVFKEVKKILWQKYHIILA